jgi:hypothetical protein
MKREGREETEERRRRMRMWTRVKNSVRVMEKR